jgi:ACS family allantoate permease-like MFS transporter
MQKLPIGKYFGVMVLLWGMVSTYMAATNSFTTLATCRFFLVHLKMVCRPFYSHCGTILDKKAAASSRFYLVGRRWYRIFHCRFYYIRCIWQYLFNGQICYVAGIRLAAVNNNPNANMCVQVIFLIFGPLTIGWGIVLYFCLPTSPMTAWFLTEREEDRCHEGIFQQRIPF